MKSLIFLLLIAMPITFFAQAPPTEPPIEPGVSRELARWRAAHYSDIRYKLDLTLEKMSPVLKGTIEITVNVNGGVGEKGSGGAKASQPGTRASSPSSPQGGDITPIILDWRRIKGYEQFSTISNVTVNGIGLNVSPSLTVGLPQPDAEARASARAISGPTFQELNEHLIFRDDVVAGENVIKLDFTSPILPSGSAITRYIDKEDGSEYIYSLFVPSDASTAFPVFDQPDLKAKFELSISIPKSWRSVVSNSELQHMVVVDGICGLPVQDRDLLSLVPGNTKPPRIPTQEELKAEPCEMADIWSFKETKPISTYVFAFAAGPWEKFIEAGDPTHAKEGLNAEIDVDEIVKQLQRDGALSHSTVQIVKPVQVFVRKSQAEKFKPHAAEVFRLNREAIKYFEEYFDYKFPFPKYDLVLIPEFPFGGMEHAGATFLRESSIIFPQEPTANDHISRALLLFHEASHQWFGDTVTMRWFDDLWLKEGFATFTAYKAMEKIMPEANAWKVFYERVKQAAYRTDSTRGTTPIYQEINNLSAAKSAYGAIVYSKAPAFLRQTEFYLGEDKFQVAVRAVLKKHEFGNATWQELVREFEAASGRNIKYFAEDWVTRRGLFKTRLIFPTTKEAYLDDPDPNKHWLSVEEVHVLRELPGYEQESKFKVLLIFQDGTQQIRDFQPHSKPDGLPTLRYASLRESPVLAFPNYQDYGYGIFLLDEKSRAYVLKNVQNEQDPFLRSMMWGALWDSVREGELDPREYLELVVKHLKVETDESTIATLIGRVSTATNYYLSGEQREKIIPKIEAVLLGGIQEAKTPGQRITFYRAYVNMASTDHAQEILKKILKSEGKPIELELSGSVAGEMPKLELPPLKTKDKFDIVSRLLILENRRILGNDEAERLLADLEKTETSDDAKRYAYAARAGIATADNKAKYWKDFTENKELSESWIEAAFVPWNSIRHSELTLPFLGRALKELPNHKRNRKIFFVNGWLGAFIGGHRSEKALEIINGFLADNPNLDNDLRLKILENADLIERAVKIREKFGNR